MCGWGKTCKQSAERMLMTLGQSHRKVMRSKEIRSTMRNMAKYEKK
jgi:hypothetical protein